MAVAAAAAAAAATEVAAAEAAPVMMLVVLVLVLVVMVVVVVVVMVGGRLGSELHLTLEHELALGGSVGEVGGRPTTCRAWRRFSCRAHLG